MHSIITIALTFQNMCIVTNGCNSFSLTVQDIPKRRNRGHYCLSSISMGRLSAVALVQVFPLLFTDSIAIVLKNTVIFICIYFCFAAFRDQKSNFCHDVFDAPRLFIVYCLLFFTILFDTNTVAFKSELMNKQSIFHHSIGLAHDCQMKSTKTVGWTCTKATYSVNEPIKCLRHGLRFIPNNNNNPALD
ncbi:hypothetical protein BDF14DRAFT_1775923 [Spinellus fusiger]|nr:hypothetical protein BDF14DRAFT_1775923 [Spinellus fusiger]